jgi:hypothetical protein
MQTVIILVLLLLADIFFSSFGLSAASGGPVRRMRSCVSDSVLLADTGILIGFTPPSSDIAC